MSAMTTRAVASTLGRGDDFQLELLNDQSWMAQGACLGLDPTLHDQLFFPPNEDYIAEPAKRICRECPVRMECLEYAITTRLPVDEDPTTAPRKYRDGGVVQGIWGGMTTRQRAQLRRHWGSS